MVFQSSKVFSRNDSICGSTWTKPRPSNPNGRAKPTTSSIPVGLNPYVWQSIIDVLCIPHFSHTKKLDLIYQKNIPVIFGFNIKPVLSCRDLFLSTDYANEQVTRFYPGMCNQCFLETMKHNQKTDLMICSYCGNTSVPQEVSWYVSSNRRNKIARKFSCDFHKRVLHFKYWLKRLQGKEKNMVSQEVIEVVKQHIKFQNVKGIHYWVVRNALKSLGLQKYYPNTVSIMSCIRGQPLFKLQRTHEEELITMFLSLQDVFSNLQNKRVNMLSYPFVVKKLCEIKGWKRLANVIPTLKSHSRLISQDILWREICVLKGWNFTPTAQWSFLESRSLNSKPR